MDKEDVAHMYTNTHTYTYNGILISHKKEWNLANCDNTDGPRMYYAKWNKADRERQKPYDFTYIRNLKNKTNEQT